jgi:hypothetical protein
VEYLVRINDACSLVINAYDLSNRLESMNVNSPSGFRHVVCYYSPLENLNQLVDRVTEASDTFDASNVNNTFTRIRFGQQHIFTGLSTVRSKLSNYIENMKR